MGKHYRNWADAAAAYRDAGEPYVLVTVLEVTGSAPRNTGTKMLVGVDTLVDTIGGGHLEHDAIQKARNLIASKNDAQHIEQYPLSSKLGQCCGGRVTVLFECFQNLAPQIAVFGAGHVGRALVSTLAKLPVKVRWIDSRQDEFPSDIPAGVVRIVAAQPEDEVADLPANAYVVVLTHLHPLDYAITEAVLRRGDSAYLGVIGSQTKARRFVMRLKHRGFNQAHIAHMRSPIGAANVPGKHPMEVAVSIAAQIIEQYQSEDKKEVMPILTGVKLLELTNSSGKAS